MEKSSFFNSEIINGEYDRVYLAEDYARYFSSFIGNGVFPNPSSNLKVTAEGDSMKVIIAAGKAWVNGYYYENDSDLMLQLSPADGVLTRIDRIVIRLDFLEREITVKVKEGSFSSSPVALELERSVDAYELAIADVRINNGIISIVNSNINDLRLNNNLCGLSHGVIEQVDTTDIFNTYQQYLNEKLTGSEFNDWFMSLKNKLDPFEDLALQLQLQVDALENKILNIEDSIGENLNEQLMNKAEKNGELQENLNADMLDGKHASDFILNGQTQAQLKSIELSDTKPYIDFHYNNSSVDYTSRIIEESSGVLTITNNLKVGGKINDKTISGTLATNEKTNIITAINEVFQNASNGKTKIATAITGKGISASGNDSFDALASKISQIKGDFISGKVPYAGQYIFDGTSRAHCRIPLEFTPKGFLVMLTSESFVISYHNPERADQWTLTIGTTVSGAKYNTKFVIESNTLIVPMAYGGANFIYDYIYW